MGLCVHLAPGRGQGLLSTEGSLVHVGAKGPWLCCSQLCCWAECKHSSMFCVVPPQSWAILSIFPLSSVVLAAVLCPWMPSQECWLCYLVQNTCVGAGALPALPACWELPGQTHPPAVRTLCWHQLWWPAVAEVTHCCHTLSPRIRHSCYREKEAQLPPGSRAAESDILPINVISN